ncbi:flagellar basal body rod protein FlgB [Lutibacter sp. B2]|nr:flagellar basal body rod protein FlgB [Lutibacter sp. B2]
MLEKSLMGINILEKSMNACWMRNEAIVNNIANVDTPNYKRDMVKFETVLEENLSSTSIEGKMTHEKHLAIQPKSIENINPVMAKDLKSKYRKDGNNINIDAEMARLAKNTLQYNLLAQRVSGKIRKLKMLVKDGR